MCQIGSVTVHVMVRGDWTRKLHEFFLNAEDTCGGTKWIARSGDTPEVPPTEAVVETTSGNDVSKQALAAARSSTPSLDMQMASGYMKRFAGQVFHKIHVPVHLEGSYGSKEESILHTEHAVMIAAGVNLAPFCSILQSIVCRYQVCCHQGCLQWGAAAPTRGPLELSLLGGLCLEEILKRISGTLTIVDFRLPTPSPPTPSSLTGKHPLSGSARSRKIRRAPGCHDS